MPPPSPMLATSRYAQLWQTVSIGLYVNMQICKLCAVTSTWLTSQSLGAVLPCCLPAPQVKWETTPACSDVPTTSNSMPDADGRLWGWDAVQEDNCAFKDASSGQPIRYPSASAPALGEAAAALNGVSPSAAGKWRYRSTYAMQATSHWLQWRLSVGGHSGASQSAMQCHSVPQKALPIGYLGFLFQPAVQRVLLNRPVMQVLQAMQAPQPPPISPWCKATPLLQIRLK